MVRQIEPDLTELEVQRLVDDIVIPGSESDQQAQALTKLLYSTASPESNDTYERAEIASRYAFTKTTAFEEAFRDFAGFAVELAHVRNNDEAREVGSTAA